MFFRTFLFQMRWKDRQKQKWTVANNTTPCALLGEVFCLYLGSKQDFFKIRQNKTVIQKNSPHPAEKPLSLPLKSILPLLKNFFATTSYTSPVLNFCLIYKVYRLLNFILKKFVTLLFIQQCNKFHKIIYSCLLSPSFPLE